MINMLPKLSPAEHLCHPDLSMLISVNKEKINHKFHMRFDICIYTLYTVGSL